MVLAVEALGRPLDTCKQQIITIITIIIIINFGETVVPVECLLCVINVPTQPPCISQEETDI